MGAEYPGGSRHAPSLLGSEQAMLACPGAAGRQDARWRLEAPSRECSLA